MCLVTQIIRTSTNDEIDMATTELTKPVDIELFCAYLSEGIWKVHLDVTQVKMLLVLLDTFDCLSWMIFDSPEYVHFGNMRWQFNHW